MQSSAVGARGFAERVAADFVESSCRRCRNLVFFEQPAILSFRRPARAETRNYDVVCSSYCVNEICALRHRFLSSIALRKSFNTWPENINNIIIKLDNIINIYIYIYIYKIIIIVVVVVILIIVIIIIILFAPVSTKPAG